MTTRLLLSLVLGLCGTVSSGCDRKSAVVDYPLECTYDLSNDLKVRMKANSIHDSVSCSQGVIYAEY